MRSLRGRVKAVGTYIAERREADRFQPEGWETAEGRAILSQYRAELTGTQPAVGFTGEETAAVPQPAMSRPICSPAHRPPGTARPSRAVRRRPPGY